MQSRLQQKHEKSAAKYRKIVCEDFIRIKKSLSTNHMIRIISGVKTKSRLVRGWVLHGFCVGFAPENQVLMASIPG